MKGLSGTLYLCNVVLFVVRMAWWYIRVDSGESSLGNRDPRELLERLRILKGSSGVTGGEMNRHSQVRNSADIIISDLQTPPRSAITAIE